MNSFAWKFFTVVIFLTLHLKIFSVSNFGVSLSFIFLPLWVYFTFSLNTLIYNKYEFPLFVTILLIPFISLSISNYSEFLKTYIQFIISYLIVTRTYQKRILFDKKTIDKTLKIIQIILLITTVLQFFLVIVIGNTNFYNIFGEHQLYYQLNILIAKGRMKAFYLEPSFLGFVVLNVFWCRKYLNNYKNIINYNLLLSSITILLSGSAFAYYGITAIILYDKFFNTNNKINPKTILELFFVVIVVVFNMDNIYEIFRLEEFQISPDEKITSSYMRVLLPFEVVKSIIFEEGFYLGIPFGTLEFYVEDIFGDYGESNINNSFFLIIGYFGFIGVFLILVLLIKGIIMKNGIVKSFIILTIINLNNSGAFVTTQYIMVAFLLPFLVINNYENKIIYNNSSSK